MKELQSLWPEIYEPSEALSPRAILDFQAAKLGDRTRNIVTADVRAKVHADRVYLYFYIVAPVLDKYRYLLAIFAHDIERLYPVDRLAEDFLPTNDVDHPESVRRYENEDEFVTGLKELFAEEKTLRVITSLLAQSK